MINSPYYHGFLKKYVILFGTLFNNIFIERTNNLNVNIQRIKVPVQYGPREKFLARVEVRPNLKEPTMQLPRMGFEITSLVYDPTRKLNTTNRITRPQKVISANTISNAYRSIYSPVPYNIGFKLSILSKTVEDGNKIVEQILPHFTPEWTISAKLVDSMPDLVLDLPIVLNSVSQEDNYESDFKTRRILIWELDFTFKGYFFSSASTPKVITIADVFMYTGDTTNTEWFAKERLVAGINSSGNPTSNVQLIPQYDANTYINPKEFFDDDTGYPYFVIITDKS